MSDMIRLFTALEVSEKQKEEIRTLQNNLETSNSKIRWIQNNNLHITLKFLGETDQKLVKTVTSIIDEIAAQNNTFELSFGGLGVFPAYHKAKVIWVGINEGLGSIREIAVKLDERMSEIGVSSEKKPFQPHLTIGRAKSVLSSEELLRIEQGSEGFTTEQSAVNGISLFQSNLTRKGAIYYLVHKAEFSKG